MSHNKYDKDTDTLIQISGNATVPIDDTTASTDKVYSSSKVENSFLKFNGYITDGADLNNFTEDGRYHIQNIDLVNAIPNYKKMNDWGFLEVVSFPNYISQSYTTFVNKFRQEYARRYYNGNWSDWKLANPDYYLTTETMTNKVWIDGKPIYRKVINYNQSLPNNDALQYIHNISIDTPIKASGIAYNDNNKFTFPSASVSGLTIHLDLTKVSVQATVDRSDYKAYFIIEYTKND